MSLTGCTERVRKLFNSNAAKSDLEKLYFEFKKTLFSMEFVSENYLSGLLKQGQVSRCLEVGWCIPQESCGKYVAIRLDPSFFLN